MSALQEITDQCYGRQRTVYGILRIALGAVLVIAAVAKAYQVSFLPVHPTAVFNTRWFRVGHAEYELLLGTALILNLAPIRIYYLALGTFATFACVSIFHAIVGHRSCSCMGAIDINPWIVAAFDIVACMLLVYFGNPRRSSSMHPVNFPPLRVIAISAMGVVSLLLAAWTTLLAWRLR